MCTFIPIYFCKVSHFFSEFGVILASINGNSVAWGLFEHLYGKHRPGWLGGYGNCDNLGTDKEEGNGWYGKWSDIGCNTIGFLIGRYLQSRVF
jgi:hypothetical protein